MKPPLLYTLILMLLLAACYKDGPIISFRSKKYRINGDKDIKEVLVDGKDSTQLYQQRLPEGIDFLASDELWAAYYVDVQVSFYTKDTIFPTNYHVGYGNFIRNHRYLQVAFHYGDGPWGPIGAVGVHDWKILKLTSTEFWFETEFENREYVFKLD